MTAVLLIADTERVQRVFADLESKGVLQLHAAATLDQVDQELTASLPEFTFVQSRISGLSTGILLRHLKKALPENSRIILLSGDAGDLQPTPPLAMPLVDLRVADDILAETVSGIVAGTAPPSSAEVNKPPKREGEAKKAPQRERVARRKGGNGEQADAQEPQGDGKKGNDKGKRPQVKAKKPQGVKQAPLSQAAKQVSASQAEKPGPLVANAPSRVPETEAAAAARAKPPPPERSLVLKRSLAQEGCPGPVEPREHTHPERGPATLEPREQNQPVQRPATVNPPPEHAVRQTEEEFTDLPQPAARFPAQDVEVASAGEASTVAPPYEPSPALEPSPAGEPAVAEPPAAVSFVDMMQAAAVRRGPDVSFPLDVEDRVRVGDATERVHLTGPAKILAQPAEPREPGTMPREEGLLPGEDPAEKTILGSGKRNKPLWLFVLLFAFVLIPSTGYLVGRMSKAPEQEVRQGGSVADRTPALFAAATSGTARTASRAATGTSPEGAHPQKAAQASGLATLPPFLEGLEVDRGYSDRHPGWERYLGAKAEYKVFREGGRYRAVQAIARADEIPDQLFRRVLLEFGGIAGYAVNSTEQKGNYLVEQARASGSASLTVYRNRNDARIKGLVVYYR